MIIFNIQFVFFTNCENAQIFSLISTPHHHKEKEKESYFFQHNICENLHKKQCIKQKYTLIRLF